MTKKRIQHQRTLNAVIYVDYENIFELLRKYEVNLLDINFFPVIMDKFKKKYNLHIIESIAFANFEKQPFSGRHQTSLHNLGVETRHTASKGKNCGDIMLTVDALVTLFHNPHINCFVIVSSDRDFLPLIHAIKRENKFVYMLSTKYGFNQAVSSHADYHEYIEDIFGLTPEMLVQQDVTPEVIINDNEINENDIKNAKEVSKLLYTSNVWKIYEREGNPVTLQGYLKIISSKISADSCNLIRYFKLAHHFKYITIYRDDNKGLCLKRGDKYLEILGITEIKE